MDASPEYLADDDGPLPSLTLGAERKGLCARR